MYTTKFGTIVSFLIEDPREVYDRIAMLELGGDVGCIVYIHLDDLGIWQRP